MEGKILGPTLQPDRTLDQASRLRALAAPTSQPPSSTAANSILAAPNSSLISTIAPRLEPRVVLISEYPVLQGGFELAWRLAQQYSQAGSRTAIVDLSPSASRLPAELARLEDRQVQAVLATRQSLWSHTPHGRGLTTWSDGGAQVDLSRGSIHMIAQPVGEYPTAEQLPRIYEQFLRAVGSGRRGNHLTKARWNTLVLLSEAHGVPLDAACWQAADEILFALPSSDSYREEARAALAARLSSVSGQQRRIALWKQETRLSWAIRRNPLKTVTHSGMTLFGFDNRQVHWPHESHSLFGARRRTQPAFARAARELADELNRLPL